MAAHPARQNALMIPLSEALGLDRPRFLHALQLAVAAILAFAIACAFHVQKAYWAAMPVFVVAQPTRGLIFERGALCLPRTLIGAGFCLERPDGLMLAPLATKETDETCATSRRTSRMVRR